MNYIRNISPRLAAASAVGAAAMSVLLGSLLLAQGPSSESTVVGIEHLTVAALSVTCLLTVPMVLYLGGLADRPRPAVVASVGLVTLAVLAAVSNVRGSDPSFFPAVAGPANLLWFGGLVVLAVRLRRASALPGVLVVGLPLAWALTIPLSPIGGAIAAGVYWLLVARAISPAPVAARVQAASAA